MKTTETSAISNLHESLLTCWNNQDGPGMASLFTDDGNVVGFDGSQMNRQAQIETELSRIFTSHKTARYVWKIQEIRFLSSTVALLRAIVGMVPPDKKNLNPARNAIQSLIATEQSGSWRICLFQNTPAQLDGRPEAVDAMTEELTKLL